MKAVEKILPTAIEAAKKKISSDDGISIPKVYNGYISSFGASVIQAGLLPAVANLEKDTERTEGKPKFIADAILFILGKEYSLEYNSLTQAAIENKANLKFKRDVLNIATALKLAIRTFVIIKD